MNARARDPADAKAETDEAATAKSSFLAAASHDMLQPLRAAEMFTAMLASEPLSTRGENLLRELRRTQNSLQHLVRSVLEVSRLEAGTVSPNFQPVPVRPLLNGLAAEFAPQALARNLRLKIVAQDVTVTSDPILLERVLRNLVGNALRYTETGGVLIGARQRGERVWLQVIDSGRGHGGRRSGPHLAGIRPGRPHAARSQ